MQIAVIITDEGIELYKLGAKAEKRYYELIEQILTDANLFDWYEDVEKEFSDTERKAHIPAYLSSIYGEYEMEMEEPTDAVELHYLDLDEDMSMEEIE